MGNIVYGKFDKTLAPIYGNYEHPIKMLIESESNAFRQRNKLVDLLYNVEKSTNYSETVTEQTDFDVFEITGEGQGAPNDSVGMGHKKTIFHHQFMKEFTITAEMMEDSKMGIAPEMKRRATKFIGAYEKTRAKLAAAALFNGTASSMTFGGGAVDLTVGDGKALFANNHTYANRTGTQSNYFYANFSGDVSKLESTLNVAAITMRGFKDENGEALGYYPDIIVIPGNQPILEANIKKICDSEKTVGSGNNDSNLQYGNWTILAIPEWETSDERFILVSSEANKQLFGSAFYERTKLTVNAWVDNHTSNFIWTGRARMGVGHNTWKHAAMIKAGASATDATQLVI